MFIYLRNNKCIAMCEIAMLCQVIYEHYEDIRIVGASINAARTLIGDIILSRAHNCCYC